MIEIEIFLIRSMIRLRKPPRSVSTRLETRDYAHNEEMLHAVQEYESSDKLGFSPKGPPSQLFESWFKDRAFSKHAQALVHEIYGDQKIKILFLMIEGDRIYGLQSFGPQKRRTMVAWVADRTKVLVFFSTIIEFKGFGWTKVLGWTRDILGYWELSQSQFELWSIDYKELQSGSGKQPLVSMRYFFDSSVPPQLRISTDCSKIVYLTQLVISRDYYWPSSTHIITLNPGKGFSEPITLKDTSKPRRQPLLYQFCEF